MLSFLCQELFSYQLIGRRGCFVYSYLHLPEIGTALVLQLDLGLEALTFLGRYIPRSKAVDSERNLT